MEKLIVETYFRNSHGIRGTAGRLGLSKSYVGKVITRYKRKHNIR